MCKKITLKQNYMGAVADPLWGGDGGDPPRMDRLIVQCQSLHTTSSMCTKHYFRCQIQHFPRENADSECTRTWHFKSRNHFFSGEGHSPLSRPFPHWGYTHPHTPPLNPHLRTPSGSATACAWHILVCFCHVESYLLTYLICLCIMTEMLT